MQTPISDSDKKIHQSWGGDEGQTELATETAAANDAAAEQTVPAENWETTVGGEDWAAGGGGAEWAAGGGDTSWGAEGGGDTKWGAEGGDSNWAAPDSAPAPTTNIEEPADPEQSNRRPRDRQEEEPDNTLTLDQYIAQQKEKTPLVPQLETRKVDQDESLWKGAKELVKGAEEVAYFVGKVRDNRVLLLALTHNDLDQGNSQGSRKEGREGLLGDRCPFRASSLSRSRSW